PNSGNKSDGRLAMQAQAVLPKVKFGFGSLNDFRLLARESVYGSGDHFTVLGTGIAKRFRIGHFTLSVSRFDMFTEGRTPFLFDDVELRQEWRPALSYHSK